MRTPFVHSLVSRSIWPSSCGLEIALGFIVCCLTFIPNLFKACFRSVVKVVFPEPLGPTITTPILCLSCSNSSIAFLICLLFISNPISLQEAFRASSNCSYPSLLKFIPGKKSLTSWSNLMLSTNVNFETVFNLNAFTAISVSLSLSIVY